MKPAPSQRAAEPASLEDVAPSELTSTSPRTQQPQQLGGVTRRIVERLDQQRAWPKPKGGPSDGAQRKAAFHDPRQLRLPISRPNTKDNSYEKA